MSVFRSIRLASAAFLLAQINFAIATIHLSPAQDIVLPASESSREPLEWLGANSPYFAGPNINGISNDVPEGCYVEQVAYVVRHGSRYPDSGAYKQWTTLYAKIQAASFTSTGSLAFLKEWQPVLTNPTAQIAQESPTGYKEAYDLGYKLRTRYPDLYAYGTPFMSWANLYPRVVQTAQNFVRGFLGSTASSLGTVYTVSSTGSADALFDSLSPSDQCPHFVDGNGGTAATTWNALYLPPILSRLNTMLSGNLTFTTTDVSIMPYLCGFESQITGTLSPWCSVFTDAELKQYEYAQDLRYYYGMGPGTDLPSKMMLPFVNKLVSLLAEGPGINGTYANGTSYVLPDIITAFMNDGQITEVGSAIGVWDNTTVLSGTEIPNNHTYIASHFVTMRGTVAFERLNCVVSDSSNIKAREEEHVVKTSTKTKTKTECSTGPSIVLTDSAEYATSTSLSTSTYTITSCLHDARDCHIGGKTTTVITSEIVHSISNTVTSHTPTITTGSVISPSNYATSTPISTPASFPSYPNATSTNPTNTTSTSTATSLPTPGSSNQTYIRILLNDAVYPVPSCQNGPGRSCLMGEYVSFIQARLAAAGDLRTRCNVTNAAAPTALKGASFFTNLSDSWVASVLP